MTTPEPDGSVAIRAVGANQSRGGMTRSDAPGAFRTIITSGIVLTAVAVILQLQGYAYRAGYFNHFGLDSGMFEISAGQLMWDVVLAWSEFTAKLLKGIWPAYLHLLKDDGFIIFVVSLATLWVAGACLRYGHRFPTPKSGRLRTFLDGVRRLKGTFLGKRFIEVVISAAMPFWVFGVAPLVAFAVTFAFAIGFVVLLYPFYQIGGAAAAKFCERPVAEIDKVWLASKEGAPRFGYLIACDDAKCAVAIDRSVQIVQNKNVAYIEIATQASQSVSAGKGGFCPAVEAVVPITSGSRAAAAPPRAPRRSGSRAGR
jgi:hypothetical protein